MPRLRPRITTRALLVLVACAALACWAWPIWLRYRTSQTIRSFGRLQERDSATHGRATEAILGIGGGRASVAPLIEALRGDDAGLKYTAGMALGAIGPDAAAAVPTLIELLRDPSLYARQVAPGTLAAIGPAARPALPALDAALDDAEWLMRMNAAWAILILDPASGSRRAIPVLERLLDDPDPVARFSAERILREFKPADPTAVEDGVGPGSRPRPRDLRRGSGRARRRVALRSRPTLSPVGACRARWIATRRAPAAASFA
jgi:HEAT repeat protein